MNSRRNVASKRVVIVAPPRVTLQDLTGPYEVFARAARRVPGSYRIEVASFGPGTRVTTKFGLEIRCDLLELIATQVASGRVLFSVCTGALLCGAAGVLRGRRATTHWASFALLPYFGAVAVNERVVVDGNIVSAAGITAGIDGALKLAALLRGDEAAERIQLDIQYAPEPPFHSGTPDTATPAVLHSLRSAYAPMTEARTRTAQDAARRLGITMQ